MSSGLLIPATRLQFILKHWCLWQSSPVGERNSWPNGRVLPSNQGDADVGFLPMLQRRRLSRLAKAVCAVTWQAQQHSALLPTVFYSRHGESRYYFQMLEDMAAGEPLSPSRFSLSVHNAIAGLCSIHAQNCQPYVCLAGGTEGLFAGFLEAAGLLLSVPQVLLVAYEQPLPELYQAYQARLDMTWALAMVLSRDDQPGLHLSLTRQPATAGASDDDRQFVQAIINDQRQVLCQLAGASWHCLLEDV